MSDPSDWSHHRLQADLVRARRENGEIAVQELSLAQWGSAGWVDVAAAKPSWTSFNPTAYEVKASRSDFTGDARGGKYQRYLPFFRRFYFATPAGMVKKKEVPEGCGLIVRSEKGWSGVVAPSVREIDDGPFTQLLMAMLFRQKKAPWRSTEDSPQARAERVRRYREHLEATEIVDGEVRKQIHEARSGLRKLERARKRVAKALGEEVDGRSLKELVEALIAREAADAEILRRLEWDVDRLLRRAESSASSVVDRLAEARENVEELGA